MNAKRRALLSSTTYGAAIFALLPNAWHKPIVNAVVLPAHAMTSDDSCSLGFDVEPIDQPIQITITATEARGPIIASLSDDGSFDDTQVLMSGECSDDSVFSQEVMFSGSINSATSEITGDLLITQFCGGVLFCEQVSTFTASQTPSDSNSDLGDYQGRVIGTLTCCRDFL